MFPRPRVTLGLPAPEGFRAHVGLAYIPPITLNEVSSHLGAIDAGLAWAPEGPISVGLRGYFMPEDDRSTLYIYDVR